MFNALRKLNIEFRLALEKLLRVEKRKNLGKLH